MQLHKRLLRAHWPLWVILIVYFSVGGLYAWRVPAWQTPDEPAHYNYIRQLAQAGSFPIIEMGDYDQQFLSEKVRPPKTRPDVSLDAVQYEDHQPPLFYALAAPLFKLFDGALLPLRLFSLFISGWTIVFAYRALLSVFPNQPEIAPLAAAVLALIPQHIHMMAGLNNDALAEALIALTVLLSTCLLVNAASPQVEAGLSPRLLVGLGIVVGLSFVTKATAYLNLPIALAAILGASWGRRSVKTITLSLAIVIVIAVAIGLPWWLRSLQVYGGLDFLGLQRHNEVVVGQPTTREWLEQFGPAIYLARMAQTTFQSFWGQFGWMSVVMNTWTYALLLVFTALSMLLFAGWWIWTTLMRGGRGRLTTPQRHVLSLYALLALGTLAGFLWYNIQFVQHQGRYLYPALIPFATAVALGWTFAAGAVATRWPPVRRYLWTAFLIGLAGFNLYLLWRVVLPGMDAALF
ncbi:MAG: DUF2142 domain-containing protein [Anaerolineae bacterium]|nr:DUF2142 domain-containing protein [Thermoflexales bacterium]MDW8407526.1 DUF2142 domain-containing protein [Anaerolineae bacterium]